MSRAHHPLSIARPSVSRNGARDRCVENGGPYHKENRNIRYGPTAPGCGLCRTCRGSGQRAMPYEYQVAVITGASSGIGWEMARVLAAKGCAVGLVARRL